MKPTINSGENFNELVFENKNKAYGAYAIRRSYRDNVSISLLLSTTFFGLLALLAIFLTNRDVKIPVFTGNDPPAIPFGRVIEIAKLDKPVVVPKKKVEAIPKSTSGQKVASDNPNDKNNQTNDQQNTSKNPNPNGNDSTAIPDPEIKLPILTGNTPPPPVEKFADKMPKFDNMAQFIADHLVYPRAAVESGTSGTVFVTFVVEMDGSITDIKLLKGIGDGCEQEAMRVVGIMPPWEPGMNKNKPVRVQCNLPIKFRIK
jgi:protein TonB